MSDENSGAVDSVDQGEGAQPDAGAQVAESTPQRIKLNIYGREEEHDLEEVKRLAQIGKAGQQSLQKAAEMRKAVQQFEEQFGKDPVSAMVQKFGPEKTKEMLEHKLYEFYQKAKETPEQRESREAKEELSRLKAEREAEKAKAEEFRQQQLEDHFANKWNREFTDAIKTTGMEHNAFNVARMSELALLALDNELDVNPVDIAKMVKAENEDKLRKLTTTLSPEQLMQYLGDEMVDKIRKANLTKLKTSPVQRRPGTAPKPRKSSPSTPELSKEERWELYKAKLAKEG